MDDDLAYAITVKRAVMKVVRHKNTEAPYIPQNDTPSRGWVLYPFLFTILLIAIFVVLIMGH
jgi:hypothetical protein